MRSFGRLHRAYQVTAIVLLNTCVLFVLVNIALFLFLEIHSKLAGQSNPIADKYGQAWLKARYPNMTENDVKGLLKETWSLHFKYEPYTQFRERPYSGRWVTVDPHGFRVSRNQGPWPPSPDYFNVFVFGGSTTFSYGVSNDQTIASYLQELLARTRISKGPRVYNWGRGFYFSSQERILYEKLLAAGYVPDMVVFIDGLNEFYYPKDEPRFTARFELFLEGWEFLKKIPLVRVLLPVDRDRSASNLTTIKDLLRQINKEERPEDQDDYYDNPTVIEEVIHRYRQNKRMIDAVSTLYNIKAAFVWQPIAWYGAPPKASALSLGRHTYAKFGYPRMAKLAAEHGLGVNFLWCADLDQSSPERLYVDSVHYSATMAKQIAQCIVAKMTSANLLGSP